MAQPHTVYGLRLRGDREVRYVGLTSRAPSYRLSQHASRASRLAGNPKFPFEKWLSDNRGDVEAFAIAQVDSEQDGRATEKAIIALCLRLNQRIFNRKHARAA